MLLNFRNKLSEKKTLRKNIIIMKTSPFFDFCRNVITISIQWMWLTIFQSFRLNNLNARWIETLNNQVYFSFFSLYFLLLFLCLNVTTPVRQHLFTLKSSAFRFYVQCFCFCMMFLFHTHWNINELCAFKHVCLANACVNFYWNDDIVLDRVCRTR